MDLLTYGVLGTVNTLKIGIPKEVDSREQRVAATPETVKKYVAQGHTVEVPYEIVHEMEDINGELGQVDVVLVLGANDVVNPAAKNDPKSPIAGMPIIDAYKARTVIVNKRSMAAGYAGLDNDLFYLDKTMMVFGDAKKVIEEMVKAAA